MKFSRTTRRRFILAALLASPGLAVADAKWLEPDWVKVRTVRLRQGGASRRFVHFTDVHHKGDRGYLLSVVSKINSLSPEFVCFTGDLVEERRHLPEALELFSQIKSPLYGVPGNHDYWSKAAFGDFAKCFAATGGAWLQDELAVSADGTFSLIGLTCLSFHHQPVKPLAGTKSILLTHYPAWVKKLASPRYDLLLAGHSHGGQVRLPFYGPVYVPFGVDEYDLGLFETASGPLYVNPGIGWFPWPIRFNCRPEITVFET